MLHDGTRGVLEVEGDGVGPDLLEEIGDLVLTDEDGLLELLEGSLVESRAPDELAQSPPLQCVLEALVGVLRARQHEERVTDQCSGEGQHVGHCVEEARGEC